MTLLVAALAAYRGRLGQALATQGIGALSAPWQQWDANWYTWIARVGYDPLSPVHTNGRIYDALVWPPLFPGLIAATWRPFGLDPGMAALLVASACLLVALVGLYRVVQLDYGDGVATLAVVLLLAYPSSLFLGAGYTEGLLLGLGAWAFWAARTGRWWLSGVLVAAAVMTKFYAVIFVAALLFEYMAQRHWSWRRVRADVAWLLVPTAVALGSWVGYVQVHFGDGARVVTSQHYWDRHLAPPWVALGDGFSLLTHLRFVGVVDLGSLLLLLGLAIYLARHGRAAYAVLLGLAALACVTTSTLSSTSRYTTVLFPMFLAAALVMQARPWFQRAVVVVSAPLMLLLLSRFATGHWAG